MTSVDPSLLSIRKAAESDRQRLFQWVNDPETRTNSFSTAPVSWSSHCEWFDGLLADQNRWLYILVSAEGQPVGQVRFDKTGDRSAEVSLSLAPEWRGRGLGAAAIALATRRVMSEADFAVVHARVKPGNEKSRRAFVRAGYEQIEEPSHRGELALHLRFEARKMV
jgi:RimJ/RimL family protein N-acetyltransferase